uniref:Uncharacterized protein n=1 Tax=Anguilla anguilla TaxID=7936 RepID=A0A0E9VD36_ANGAN
MERKDLLSFFGHRQYRV